MTFGAFSRFWSAPLDPHFRFSIHKIAQLAQTNQSFREKLTTKWVKDYCTFHKLPLLLPIEPHQTVQALALGLTEEIEEKHIKADTIACAGLYLAEVLDSLHHLKWALEVKQEIKQTLYYGVKTQEEQEALEDNWHLYRTNLSIAQGKGNFHATYLLLYETLSADLKDLGLIECIEKFFMIKQREFIWFAVHYDAAAHLYIAELYYIFAISLFHKVLDEKQKKQNNSILVNRITEKREYQSLMNECHKIIAECIFNARAALNQYEEEAHFIEPFTKNNMCYFTENMTGYNPSDVVAKLRIRLNELDAKNNEHTLPLDALSYILNPKFAVDVNLTTLPWQERLVMPSTSAIPSKAELPATDLQLDTRPLPSLPVPADNPVQLPSSELSADREKQEVPIENDAPVTEMTSQTLFAQQLVRKAKELQEKRSKKMHPH